MYQESYLVTSHNDLASYYQLLLARQYFTPYLLSARPLLWRFSLQPHQESTVQPHLDVTLDY